MERPVPDDPSGPFEYVAVLTDVDRLRVRYYHRGGIPTDLLVQLECEIDGRWVAARRYDTHMSLHVHTAPWDETADSRMPVRVSGLKVGFNLAVDERKSNRHRYR